MQIIILLLNHTKILKRSYTLVLTCFTFLNLSAQPFDKTCETAHLMMGVIDKYHYEPYKFTDQISEQVYGQFIEHLDPSGLYFTEKDIAYLNQFKYLLNDQIGRKSCIFLERTADIFKKKLIVADTIISQLLAKPLDFSQKDTIFFYHDNDSVIYQKDDAALQKKWRKWLKYQVLDDLASQDSSKKIDLSGQKKVQEKVKLLSKRKIKRILNGPKGYENYVSQIFLQSICNRFDPHTEYFSGDEKASFESSLSTETYTYGLGLGENDQGEIEVVYLMPGGPAWKSNQIHVGDKLVKIKSPGGNLLETSLMEIAQIEAALHSPVSAKIEITIVKKNGQINTLTLNKEKISTEENRVKSYVLTGDKKIAYIKLPSFYTDMESYNRSQGCANDVAKELLRLQAENVQGLILDLRYNGGGSVFEVLELAGIFINEGPLLIHKRKNEKPTLLKDLNRGIAFSGPLVIMVNGYSASASELLAGSLQDYNRALIVGTPTFGKATGQVILPVDTTEIKNMEKKHGFVKVTIERFYKCSGRSHQLIGIQPDILLPEISFYYQSEADAKYALQADSINKKVSFIPFSSFPLTSLQAESLKRLTNHPSFKEISTLNDSVDSFIEKLNVCLLKPEAFLKRRKTINAFYDQMKDIFSFPSNNFTVKEHGLNHPGIDAKNPQTDKDLYIKKIKEDIYVDEAYQIIRDQINLQ